MGLFIVGYGGDYGKVYSGFAWAPFGVERVPSKLSGADSVYLPHGLNMWDHSTSEVGCIHVYGYDFEDRRSKQESNFRLSRLS